jgi:hypothetical protein
VPIRLTAWASPRTRLQGFPSHNEGPRVCYKRRPMGRNDNRKTWKMRRKKRQEKLKARTKRRITTAKAAKKPAETKKKK